MNNKFQGYVIYTDMDGTLLNDEKEISKENINAIKYFTQNGGKFSIATGRAIQAIEKYINEVQVNLPAIVYNGGMLATLDNIIYENVLENHQKELAYKIAEDYKEMGIEIYSGTNIYVFKDNGMSDRPATRLLDLHHDIPENIYDLKWNKILLTADEDLTNKVLKEFKNKYNEPIVKSGKFFLEILPQNTSKGSGLQKVIEIYDLNPKKVAAIGDNLNDYEMLKVSGIPFCPLNASDELKEICSYVTHDNNHHLMVDVIKELEKNCGK